MVLAAVTAVSSLASAQFRRGFGERNGPVRIAPANRPDSDFTVCRIMYTSVRREASGNGWRTDYPYGEINLMTRLSQLTKTRISRNAARAPQQWAVRLADDPLCNCPYVVASDVGTIGLSDIEAGRRRLYLEKGGVLWVDDYWGTAAERVPDRERGVDGTTTRERGSDSPEASFRAIRDKRDGHIMVVMTFNTDVADSWERVGEDPA